MRGQWDVAKPLVQNLSQLQQQQQQQQQTIDEERRQPLYLATTTPAWGIVDRSMKEEAMEEKNNDSGVSPDHYTSSNANSSFSPSSITSQDSTTMQCNTFDYSPQSMSKNYASLAEQAMDVVSSTAKSCSEDLMLEEYIMKCPICAVITTTRLQFSEHLPTHCMDKSDGPEFMRKVHEQLMNSELQQPGTSSSPTQGKRTEQEHEEADALPLVISQGKVKVHRCKYCNHIAITKTKLWEHKRIHIRKDKMLNCPKCPFVTEYKHHLEYHLRNHFGSKPFKCDQCSYACVNQSMLNSHLKSHSNVHPYRCADCPYAAKYCHTLKLHLRKSKHRPGMVLNADGSPNPLHIIDVYGTRRGPKQKPTKPKLQKQEIAQNSTVTTNINWQGVSTSPVSSPMIDNLPNTSMNGISGIMNTINTTNNGVNPINGMGAINDINAINSMNSMNPIGGLNVINPIGGMNGINPIAGLNGINPIGGLNGINAIGGLNGGVVPNRQMSYQYNKLYSQFPPVQFSTSAENQLGQLKPAALMEYAKSTAHEELPQNLVMKCKVASTANEMHYSPSEQTEVLNLEVKTVPLDLSKSSITSRAQNKPAPPTLAVRATGTSRRKGKAVKLDRRMIEEDTDEEQQLRSPQLMQTAQQTRQGPSNSEPSSSSGPRPGDPSFSGSSSDGAGCSGAGCSGASSSGATFSGPGCSGPSSSSPSSSGATENDDNDPEEPTDYYCKYCEIGFANIVMYTAHMEYHGLSDPHICKMCGLKCPEKISFFLHIARSKHT